MNRPDPGAPPKLRRAAPADFPQVLALNEESVRYLSPMDADRLQALHGQAWLHLVVEAQGAVQAFLLAFREGASYDSPNYRWFAARYPRFAYIDRVVVAPAARGGGCGRRLYDAVFEAAARAGVGTVVCEFDVEPPNEASRLFHAHFGFVEVGRQEVRGKQVSLQAAHVADRLPRPGPQP